mgnify:CR=1 FL=1
MRTSVSVNSKYYISKHRFLELRHFCLQYREWKKAILEPIKATRRPLNAPVSHSNKVYDETSMLASKRAEMGLYLQMVERTCYEADSVIGKWILIGVTEGASFDTLKAKYEIPCERNMYYDRFRKFFWLLDKKR